MTWQQSFVIGWMEFALAAAILLGVTRLAVFRLSQPVDRIRIIQIGLIAVMITPLWLLLTPLPAWHLGLFATELHPSTDSLISPSAVPTSEPRDSILSTSAAPAEMLETPFEKAVHAEQSAPLESSPTAVSESESFAWKLPDPWKVAALGISLCHLLTASFFLIERLIGLMRLSRILRTASEAPPDVVLKCNELAGNPRRIRVVISSQVDTPLTFGWWRPVIVLPRKLSLAESSTVRFCLSHEYSHIANHDVAVWQSIWWCQLVLWFQPLFWKLRRELQLCQDLIADHRSTHARVDAVEYSELLISLARAQRRRHGCAGELTFFDRPSQLVRRIKMLLDCQRPFAVDSSRRVLLLAATVATCCLGLTTSVRLTAASGEDQAASTSTDSAAGATANNQGLTYHCLVVDRTTGKPVPQAHVVVRRLTRVSQVETILEESTHTTDSLGGYTFVIPPAQVAEKALSIELDLQCQGYAPRNRVYQAHGLLTALLRNQQFGKRPFFERVELHPAEAVTGRVVSPDGKPVAGIRVHTFTKKSPEDEGAYPLLSLASHAETKTGPDGRFAMSVMKGGTGSYCIFPPDYAIMQGDCPDTQSDLGDIRLQPGIRSGGRILSADGKPLAGVGIRISNSMSHREAASDANGHFEFGPLAPGEYHLAAVSGAKLDADGSGHIPLPAAFVSHSVKVDPASTSIEFEIKAVPDVVVAGQFLDTKGQRTNGYGILINGELNGKTWKGYFNPEKDGTFKFKLPKGLDNVLLLSASNDGDTKCRRYKGGPLVSQSLRFGPLNADLTEFEFILYRRSLAIVNAVDERGKQIKDFQAECQVAPFDRPAGAQSFYLLQRQEDGRMRTSGVTPDAQIRLKVSADGYGTATETLQVPEGETREIEVRLRRVDSENKTPNGTGPQASQSPAQPKGTKFSGVIVDKETSKAVAGALVVIKRLKGTWFSYSLLEETRYTTDAEGKYSFEISDSQLAEQSLFLDMSVDHENYLTRNNVGNGAGTLSALLKNKQRGDRPFFEQVYLSPAEIATGRVLAPDGTPLGGVKVRYLSMNVAEHYKNPNETNFVETQTAADGTYRMKLLKGGDGFLSLLPDDFALVDNYIGTKRGDLGDIRLEEGIRPGGQIFRQDGKPLAKTVVQITRQSPNKFVGFPVGTSISRDAVSDQKGQFQFGPLPPGKYRIMAKELSDGSSNRTQRLPLPGVFAAQSMTLSAGSAAPKIELRGAPEISFTAQFVNGKGEKSSGNGILVSGEWTGEQWGAMGKCDAEGKASLRIPRGLQHITLTALGGDDSLLMYRRSADDPLEKYILDFGQIDQDVKDFQVVKYRAPYLVVKVIDGQGKPIPAAKILGQFPPFGVPNEPQLLVGFKLQADGRYRGQVYPDETVQLTVTAEGYDSATQSVQVPEGETKELEVKLRD